jgi:hypothetical protein
MIMSIDVLIAGAVKIAPGWTPRVAVCVDKHYVMS